MVQNFNKELVFGTFSLFIQNDHKFECLLRQTCAMFCIDTIIFLLIDNQ